ERVLSSANSIVDALRERSVEASGEPPSDRMLELALREYSRVFDEQEGGFGSAPKFPQSLQISLLLRVLRRLAEPEEQKLARRMIELTLFKMARGGIYDQIGGGFHRYSTDERWLVPHFEKMLYDNALLSVTYLEAYQLLKDNFYRQIGLETLDYMQQEMQSPEGGFYSAEDAGEVGLEGEFYVWSFEQLKSELSLDELKLAERYFGVTPQGNFEHGKNILVFDWGVPVETRAGQEFVALRKNLLEIRGKRQRPHRDEKILCGWNGLALSAFAKGYQIGGEERYLNAAQRCAEFLERIFVTEQGLKRRYFQGSVGIEATHEDYAFFIDGLIELYQSNFDLHWLELAIKLQDRQDAVFWDTNSPGYNFSVSEDAIIKKKDFLDNATPSANSVSLLNLIKLHGLAGEKRHYQRSRELAGLLSGLAHKYPLGFPKALSAFDYILEGGKEIIVVNPRGGSAGYEFVRKIQADFNPNQVVALCEPIAIEAQTALKPAAGRTLEAGRTTVYVCREHVCSAPTVNLEEAAAMCSEIRRME
ncbi:MAG: thioredoxin domain-containing protein, partial [Proteobacteria bacterium]